ncbi:MAG TPA: LPS export ABC transporter permease LptG [Alphaproteobacteria bacterium]|nr:LPS export ABC transporter permease LptG [Alphaproteobacteria bacterium]
MPVTISVYIARQFAVWFAGVVAVSAVVVMLIDMMELVRRASSRPNVSMDTIATMAMLHLPHVLEITLPFTMLFAAMAALWRMSRHQELSVAKASGLSVWQLLLPALATAFLIGVVKILAFNPLAATSLAIFEDMEARHFSKRPNNPLLSEAGLWLKDYSGAYDLIIHGQRLRAKDQVLEDVTVLQFVERDRFNARIEAEKAHLTEGAWLFENARVIGPGDSLEELENVILATKLDWSSLVESVTNPRTTPVWRLPGFIQKIEAAGFSAAPHRVHFHATLASPIGMCTMVIIAAGFTIRPPRRGGLLALISLGALTGIGYHIFNQIFLRLGQSEQIPAMLAAWAPTACVLMLGTTWLLYTEDG